MKTKLGCNYQGFDFGAPYIDSVCIEGQLYDADNCDDEGNLYEPMDYKPCPGCNHAEWLRQQRDEIEEMGWIAANEGVRATDNPFRGAKIRFPRDRRHYRRWWSRGYRLARREARKTMPTNQARA